MAKLVIVYDSKTGNTESMAEAVAEGASEVGRVEVGLKKLGAPFPMSVLAEADAVVLGSPARYAHITSEMREFIWAAKDLNTQGQLNLNGKVGGAFGSYGWDGGRSLQNIKVALTSLGVEVLGEVIAVDRMGAMGVRIDDADLEKCRQLGKRIAQRIV
jgi:NAD(P)H dehydrogenase (quinone)